jgi:hypothetical protein
MLPSEPKWSKWDLTDFTQCHFLSRVKPGRTTAALLYLLLMVLLPHAHLVLHANECDAEQPAEQLHAAHDSCALCQLLSQPAQTSETGVSAQTIPLWAVTFSTFAQDPDSFPPLPRQARAPPFMIA